MTIAKLYENHKNGKVSKQSFLNEARKDANLPWITNMTSYEDTVKILKNKGIISEANLTAPGASGPTGQKINMQGDAYSSNAETDNNELEEDEDTELEDAQSLNETHDLTTAQIIDRLNVYEFKRGVDYEMSKLKVLDNISYEKVREKVAKKMAKDPLAYRYTQLANAKQIEKDDKRLSMKPVKGDNFVDKENEMKKIKGHADEKKNTSTPKTENKKGKPKGVKEMKGSKKKPTGVKDVMKHETKETVLNEMINFFKKKDKLKENDSTIGGGGMTPQERTDFYKGHECMTPDGSGIVKQRNGSIVTVQLEDGSEKDYTLNVLDAAKEKANQAQTDISKAERDQMWANWDKQNHPTFGGMTADPKSSTQDLLKKLKGLLEKFKMKKEAVDMIKATSTTGGEEVIDTVPAGQGNKTIQTLKKKIAQKGGSAASLKTVTVK